MHVEWIKFSVALHMSMRALLSTDSGLQINFRKQANVQIQNPQIVRINCIWVKYFRSLWLDCHQKTELWKALTNTLRLLRKFKEFWTPLLQEVKCLRHSQVGIVKNVTFYLIYSKRDITKSIFFCRIFHEFPVDGPKLVKSICNDKLCYLKWTL